MNTNQDNKSQSEQLEKWVDDMEKAMQAALSFLADLNGCQWIENESVGGKDMNQRAKGLQRRLYKLHTAKIRYYNGHTRSFKTKRQNHLCNNG